MCWSFRLTCRQASNDTVCSACGVWLLVLWLFSSYSFLPSFLVSFPVTQLAGRLQGSPDPRRQAQLAKLLRTLKKIEEPVSLADPCRRVVAAIYFCVEFSFSFFTVAARSLALLLLFPLFCCFPFARLPFCRLDLMWLDR